MRRKELAINDPQLLEALLRQGTWGTLSLTDAEGWPYATPMNYAWFEGRVVLHGSPHGKRGECLRHSPRAQFTVVREMSLIPSDVFGSELACDATHYFQCAMLRGTVRTLEDLSEKASLLQALMEQLQPSGGHAPVSAADPRYTAMLRATGVWELVPEQMSAKFKFGQNMGAEKAAQLIAYLEHRQEPGDAETAEWVRRLRPERPDPSADPDSAG